jgi:hypothetical protein
MTKSGRLHSSALGCALFLASALPGQSRTGWPTLPSRPSWADSFPDAMRLPIPASIAAAEAEGRRARQPKVGCTQITSECASYFGSPSVRSCTSTLTGAIMRSGEMVLGGNATHPDGPVRMWWLPMRPSEGATLVVRARSLESPGDTLRFTMSEWSRGEPGGEFYYLTHFPWKKSGHWLVVATSGADWGCFVL